MSKHLRVHLTDGEQTLADLTFATTLELPQLLSGIQQLLQSAAPTAAGTLSERELAAIATVGKKYVPLAEHLARTEGDVTILTFAAIEDILRGALPPPARGPHAKAWWANTDTHSQGKAWLAVGWRTAVIDVDGERIEFRRH